MVLHNNQLQNIRVVGYRLYLASSATDYTLYCWPVSHTATNENQQKDGRRIATDRTIMISLNKLSICMPLFIHSAASSIILLHPIHHQLITLLMTLVDENPAGIVMVTCGCGVLLVT